jgi:hypothetical protein
MQHENDSKGIIDKMFDMTGEAFEKFGNFFRGDSTEKRHMKSERSGGKKPPLHSNLLIHHEKKLSSFLESAQSNLP